MQQETALAPAAVDAGETAPAPTGREQNKRVVGIVIGVAALILAVAAAMGWPATNGGPHEVPVAVVAPQPRVVDKVSGQLAAGAGEDAFDVRTLPDRAAAEQAILDREVYGAIVLGPEGGQMLTASAASPAIARMLRGIAAEVPPEAGGPLAVTDLRPLPEDDPRGAGLATAVLPLIIAGLVSGAASGLALRGRGRQLATVASLAVVGGLVMASVTQLWLGALDGSYWANAGVLALGIAAIGTVALGLVRILGPAGMALTALVMVLLGNTLSGIQSAPEMLPAGWGAFGQLLPPGATGTALRSVAWFDGAGSAMAFLVLACWVAAGLLLLLAPQRNVAARQ